MRGSVRGAAGVAVVTMATLLAGTPAWAQDPDPDPGDLRLEGELKGDAFQPTSKDAQEALRTGDRAWARSARGGSAEDRVRAFEAWHTALVASRTGDAVRLANDHDPDAWRWPDPGGTHERRTEDVAYAVLRRLMSLAAAERVEWRERFESLAAGELASAPYHPPNLARVEYEHPLTDSARVAALRLADIAFEEGRRTDALLWLERLQRHVTDADDATRATWDARLHAREEAYGGVRASGGYRTGGGDAAEAWHTADAFVFERAQRLETTRRLPGRGAQGHALGRSLEPGLVFLADGAALIQSPRALVWFDARAANTRTGGAIVRIVLAELLDVPRIRPFAVPSSGGWPLLPATDGSDIVLVADRGRAGYKLRDIPFDAHGNHLVHMRVDSEGQPHVHWSLSSGRAGGGLARTDAAPRDSAEVLGPGTWQFQPGPLLVDGVVFVQARLLPEPEGPGSERGGDIWLFALDQTTAEPRWSRLLTKGADLKSDLGGRLGPANQVPTSGMPLAHVAGRVVVGTNVGVALAFDAADGRQAWSVRTRRRRPEDPGWPGSRRPWSRAHGPNAAGSRVTLGPFDSDFLYSLRVLPDLDGAGLFTQPPVPIGDAEDWADDGADRLTTLGRDGRHRALRLREGTGRVRSSLYLGSEERWTGRGLVSAERLWLASDQSLMLFDQARDLFLLAAEPIPDLGGGFGGSLYGRGERVFLVGADTVWIWRVN